MDELEYAAEQLEYAKKTISEYKTRCDKLEAALRHERYLRLSAENELNGVDPAVKTDTPSCIYADSCIFYEYKCVM